MSVYILTTFTPMLWVFHKVSAFALQRNVSESNQEQKTREKAFYKTDEVTQNVLMIQTAKIRPRHFLQPCGGFKAWTLFDIWHIYLAQTSYITSCVLICGMWLQKSHISASLNSVICKPDLM